MKRAGISALVALFGAVGVLTSDAAGLKLAPKEPSPSVPGERAPAVPPPDRGALNESDSKSEEAGDVGPAEQPAWSAVGEWEAKFPSGEEKILLKKDGTISKEDGEPGRWSLTGEQGKVVLVLRWETRGTESVEMVNGNYFRGASPDGAIELRRASAKTAANRGERKNPKLVILSAMYGVEDQRVDVTLELQALVEDGWLGIPPNWRLGRIDPAEGEEKDVVIQYRSEDGRNRTARFKEDEPIVLPKE